MALMLYQKRWSMKKYDHQNLSLLVCITITTLYFLDHLEGKKYTSFQRNRITRPQIFGRMVMGMYAFGIVNV